MAGHGSAHWRRRCGESGATTTTKAPDAATSSQCSPSSPSWRRQKGQRVPRRSSSTDGARATMTSEPSGSPPTPSAVNGGNRSGSIPSPFFPYFVPNNQPRHARPLPHDLPGGAGQPRGDLVPGVRSDMRHVGMEPGQRPVEAGALMQRLFYGYRSATGPPVDRNTQCRTPASTPATALGRNRCGPRSPSQVTRTNCHLPSRATMARRSGPSLPRFGQAAASSAGACASGRSGAGRRDVGRPPGPRPWGISPTPGPAPLLANAREAHRRPLRRPWRFRDQLLGAAARPAHPEK